MADEEREGEAAEGVGDSRPNSDEATVRARLLGDDDAEMPNRDDDAAEELGTDEEDIEERIDERAA
jgi:hypothetical protein